MDKPERFTAECVKSTASDSSRSTSSDSYDCLAASYSSSSGLSGYASSPEQLLTRRRFSSVGSVADSLHTYGLSDNFLILSEEIEFKEKIGQGSFGRVFKGTIPRSNGAGKQEVAIKVIDHADLTDEEDKNIFLSEAKQSNLNHPCLVKLVAICAQVQCCLIILELEKGGSLYSFFETKKDPKQLSWSMRLQWAIDMAKGLEFLHDNNVIHRDLKSENVLLNETQTHVKLCDFGLAITKEKNSYDVLGEACGTINYWAEELLEVLVLNMIGPKKDHEYHYNFHTDTYALILMMWELTSFKRPFSELKLSLIDKSDKIIKENYRPTITAETFPGYAALLMYGWHKDTRKILNARDVREKLENIKINDELSALAIRNK